MEADFQRVYGLQLAPLVWGPDQDLSRLAVLVRHLPPDGATGGRWSVEAQLLAVIAETSDAHARAFVKAHTPKNFDVGQPIHIEWPGRKEATKPRPSTKEEIAAFFGGRVRVIPKG